MFDCYCSTGSWLWQLLSALCCMLPTASLLSWQWTWINCCVLYGCWYLLYVGHLLSGGVSCAWFTNWKICKGDEPCKWNNKCSDTEYLRSDIMPEAAQCLYRNIKNQGSWFTKCFFHKYCVCVLDVSAWLFGHLLFLVSYMHVFCIFVFAPVSAIEHVSHGKVL